MKTIGAYRRAAVLAAMITLGLVGAAAITAGAATAGAAQAPAGGPKTFEPQDLQTPMYLPIVANPVSTAVNLANGSFEADTLVDLVHLVWPFCQYQGVTDSQGNQHPSGWNFYSPAAGQPLPFPTKMQQGTSVPAISGGPGEYVHRCTWQQPENERLGQPRGLILDGNWTYKAFNNGNPLALQLSQTLTGTPGRVMEVTGYILGETTDKPTSPTGKLEDDHFIGSVQLGDVADTRLYASMIQRNDLPGNERHWNEYDVYAVVPPSGQLLLTVTMQKNWAGEVDFFIDKFSAVEWSPN